MPKGQTNTFFYLYFFIAKTRSNCMIIWKNCVQTNKRRTFDLLFQFPHMLLVVLPLPVLELACPGRSPTQLVVHLVLFGIILVVLVMIVEIVVSSAKQLFVLQRGNVRGFRGRRRRTVAEKKKRKEENGEFASEKANIDPRDSFFSYLETKSLVYKLGFFRRRK